MREVLRSLDAERPVLIAGPTASGKSALALEIAETRGGIIVNADSLQIFSCWRALTARPSAAEEATVEHHLYGHVPCDADYSVGAWLREVAPLLGGARPIIVGGTGLYLTRLTTGLAEIPPVPRHVRADASARAVASLLPELDPETAGRIDTANPARVRRAWEVQRATGRSLASWQDDTPPPLLPLEQAQPLVVEMDRDILNERIERRVRQMLDRGAIGEVHAVLERFGPASPAMKAIGAPDIAAHIIDHIPLGETRERMAVATRRYAKRQRTWFRSNMQRWRVIRLG